MVHESVNKLSPAVILSHGPGGLGAVRSLGRRGVEVTAVAFETTDLALYSRYAARAIPLAGASSREKEAHLLRVLQELPVRDAVILTTSDQMVAFVSRHAEELRKKYHFRIPGPKLLRALNDKREETALVESLGFAIPRTVPTLPEEPGDLAHILRFPIIFKPCDYAALSVFPLKNAVVRNEEELRAFYCEWECALPVLLAQEVIPGPDRASWICSCTYDERHELLDCGIKQKLRAFPAHFGGSCYALSARNPEILDLARELGRKLEYVGHAGIEFRWDARDNEYKYIEVNPRLPANVGFDEACGVPTVWNSYLVSRGEHAGFSIATQETGIRYWDAKSDFYSLRSDKVSSGRILRQFLALLLLRRTNGPYFAWDDPKPGLSQLKRFTLEFGRSQLRKLRGNRLATRTAP